MTQTSFERYARLINQLIVILIIWTISGRLLYDAFQIPIESLGGSLLLICIGAFLQAIGWGLLFKTIRIHKQWKRDQCKPVIWDVETNAMYPASNYRHELYAIEDKVTAALYFLTNKQEFIDFSDERVAFPATSNIIKWVACEDGNCVVVIINGAKQYRWYLSSFSIENKIFLLGLIQNKINNDNETSTHNSTVHN